MFDCGVSEINSRMLRNVPLIAPITVQDAIMGTGKSSWIIEKFNELVDAGTQHNEPYLVILPYLKEIERYMVSCPGMSFQEPLGDSDKRDNQYCDRANNEANTKKDDFKMLLESGYNILTTHRMFEMWDDDIALLVRDGGYHVVMDEEVSSITPLSIPMNPGERRELLELDYISVDEETRKVSWDFEKSDDHDGKYTGNKKYEIIRNHCKSGTLYSYGDLCEKSIPLYVWTIPKQFFGVAKSYTILTYRFESSDLCLFFRINNIAYNVECPQIDRQKCIKGMAKQLISFIDAPKSVMSELSSTSSLNISWYEKTSKKVKSKLRKAIGDCLKKTYSVESDNIIWACFKDYSKSSEMGIRGYLNQYLSWNCKGTNDYADRDVVVYLVNLYKHPAFHRYFDHNGIKFDQSGYALSAILQFIWRSAIRKGKPIRVMIPNPRMKKLLVDWLDSDTL